MTKILEADNISYQINHKTIVERLSLEVSRGERMALLGENGSGKTTFLNILLGDINPSAGEFRLFGNKQNRDFSRVGVLYDHLPLFPMLRVNEAIKYFCVMRNLNYQHIKSKYYERFKLNPIGKSFLSQLSQGEKKRVGLVLAIMHKPELLIMDEPFANLDPTIIPPIWKQVSKDCQTVVFTSHDWKGVQHLATKIVFLYQGKFIQLPSPPETFINSLPAKSKLVLADKWEKADFLKNLPYYRKNDSLHIFFSQKTDFLAKVSEITSHFSVLETTLEDAYLYQISQLNPTA